jgi:hypothetical protein
VIRSRTVVACLLVLVTGCAASASRGGGASAQPARPATAARLQIDAPAPNAQTGSNVLVRMRLTGAHVVAGTQTGGAVRPTEGHVHLSVDGQLVAMPYQLSYRLPPLPPGSHTVQAEYVATDHLPFANRVVAAATFEVR